MLVTSRINQRFRQLPVDQSAIERNVLYIPPVGRHHHSKQHVTDHDACANVVERLHYQLSPARRLRAGDYKPRH